MRQGRSYGGSCGGSCGGKGKDLEWFHLAYARTEYLTLISLVTLSGLRGLPCRVGRRPRIQETYPPPLQATLGMSKLSLLLVSIYLVFSDSSIRGILSRAAANE